MTETGEQELLEGDLDPADVEPEDRETGSDGTADRRSRRGGDYGRRVASGVLARAQGLDAKRAVVLALVISVVALTLAMPVRTYFSQRAEFRQLAASNEQLRIEVADYQQKVNEQNDPAYIEAQARERLQFVKPGEIPIVMMYPGDEARREAAEQAERRARAPWYGNLWESVATPPGTQ